MSNEPSEQETRQLGPVERMCVHVDIPEILPGLSCARVHFFTAPIPPREGPIETTEVVIPFQVLADFVETLPQVLKDMEAMGASRQVLKPAVEH